MEAGLHITIKGGGVMDEKIKAALEASGLLKILDEHAGEYGNGTYENTLYPEADLFAELIVRECISLLPDECQCDESKIHASWKIKQHFGVDNNPTCMHKWSRDGERCIKCGSKDWMTDNEYKPNDAVGS